MPNGATSTQPDALPEREIVRRARLLRLHVLRPVRTHLAGAYSSAFHGPGMAFDELRHYQPGDDVRHIDWHASARFGRPFVKRFVEERELRVLVALDVSASMDFGSGSVTKRRTACEALAALSMSAAHWGERVGGLFFGGNSVLALQPRRGERQALRIIREALSARPAGACTDPREALRMLGNLRGHAVVFLLSDMQFDPPLWSADVRRLLGRAAQRHEVVAITVSDPAERAPGSGVILQCRGAESGRPARLDLYGRQGELLRKHAAERAARITSSLSELGIEQLQLRTGEDCILPLRRLFRSREARRQRGLGS